VTWEEAVLWLKSQPDQQELARFCYYDDPLEEAVERYYRSSEWAAVRDLLTGWKPGRVLDVGAGRGISSYAFARDGWEVSALEPEKSPLVGTQAIRRVFNAYQLPITIIESLANSLPCESNSFDLVYARAVLHHIKDLDSFGAEVFRVLKPGGFFLFTREHVADNDRERETFLKNHPLHHLCGGEDAYPKSRYILSLRKSGLTILKVLKPADSDINLFPLSFHEISEIVKRKFRIRFPLFILKHLLQFRNTVRPVPGRLYSFMGYK
jgi:SAM-dependent methyltransferase